MPEPLRPFFPTAADFAAATAPYFMFLVDRFGFSGPAVTGEPGIAFDLRYDAEHTAVVISWEVEGGLFGCALAPRLESGDLDPDYERWLSLNEILGARGATSEWVARDEFDDADEARYARLMKREAENLGRYCADVLRGDWSIRTKAQRWLGDPPAG